MAVQKNGDEQTPKKAYEAPRLTVHGDIVTLTQGGTVGYQLDQDFPRGTPFSDLTFS